jgi:hypothetical protein
MTYDIFDVVKDTVSGNAQYASEDIIQKRKMICKRCPHTMNVLPLSSGNCRLCGCFINIKTKYRKSQCPDNPPRWLSEI